MPDLLAQIPAEEQIGSVTADGICDTKGCHIAIAARGADAVILPRRNARDWKGQDPGLQARNEALHACRRFGRANWKKLSGYHRRSRVEAKMRCLKLLGERIMAKDFDRQDAELQIRIVSQALSNQWHSPAPHEPLHITRDARDRPHALKISGKGTSPASIRIAQQSRAELKEIAVAMGWSIKHAAEVIENYVSLSPQMSDDIGDTLARLRGVLGTKL